MITKIRLMKIFLVFLSFILFTTIVSAATVVITPQNPTTSDDLTCAVSSSSANYDFYWYKNGVQFKTDFGVSSTLSHTSTSGGETWTCKVYIPASFWLPPIKVGEDSVTIQELECVTDQDCGCSWNDVLGYCVQWTTDWQCDGSIEQQKVYKKWCGSDNKCYSQDIWRSNANCGSPGYTDNYQCSGNMKQREYCDRGCDDGGTNRCYDNGCSYRDYDQCSSDRCDSWSYTCNDNDVWRERTCHDAGCANNDCYDNTYTQDEKYEECGSSGYTDEYRCSGQYQQRKYINRGCSGSSCYSNEEWITVEDCGSYYCESWGSNYCKSGDVYHSRTCYDKGCSGTSCFNNPYPDEQLVEECEYGCEGGECVTPSIECYNDGDCNDGNVCTDDVCLNPGTQQSSCQHTNNNNACNDGNACTTSDTCSNGACVGGAPLDCDDDNECTDDSCNPATGCINTPNTDPCDDGLFCTINDLCSGGTCGGTARDCSDFVGCTDDTCDETNDVCGNTANDNNCPEGYYCDQINDCQPLIECYTDADCNYLDDQCNDGICNENYQCVQVPKTDGTLCDDGFFCTVNDFCSEGSCVGYARDCSDCVGCTDDSCNEETDSCDNIPNDDNCPEGYYCDPIYDCQSLIECLTDADCPQDGYIGEPYCYNGNVYQDYRDYSCVDFHCVSTVYSYLKEECVYGCLNGICIEKIEKKVKPIGKLLIKHITFVNEDYLYAGDDLITSVTLYNTGNKDLDEMKITVSIPEHGIHKSTKRFDLRKNRELTKTILLPIPHYTEPGIYDVRIVVSNDEIKRVRIRQVII